MHQSPGRYGKIPTEIALDQDQGLPEPCAASFDDLQPIRRTYLTERVGQLDSPRVQICTALSVLADC